MSKPKKIAAGFYSYLGYTLSRDKDCGWTAELDSKIAAEYPGKAIDFGPDIRGRAKRDIHDRLPTSEIGLARKIRDFSMRDLVVAIRSQQVMTYNCLNRERGEFPISWDAKGTCCDPATETYHCM